MMRFTVLISFLLLLVCNLTLSPAYADSVSLASASGFLRVADVSSAQPNYRKLHRQLRKNQRKWHKKRPRHYQFDMNYQCFCPPAYRQPMTVTVRNGNIVATHDALTDGAAVAKALSVQQLFNKIRDAIKNKAVVIQVKYDRRYGFPRSIYIDRSQMIADEEVGLNITNFKVHAGSKPKPTHQLGQQCPASASKFCTREYRPVCGILAGGMKKTFGNACSACANDKVKSYLPGACP